MAREPHSEQAPDSAREGARVAFFEAKNYPKAVLFYKHLVMYSKKSEERLASQRQISACYFDHLTDYPMAVVEISRLVAMLQDPKEIADYKMSLARAYYYQNNFSQAENEVDEFLRRKDPTRSNALKC